MQSPQARFPSRFRSFITGNELFAENDLILLAVSGGVDSVVLAHLFHDCGFRFAIAHCNYQLRGVDSEADEVFVRRLAEKLGVPFFTTRFDTLQETKSRKLSIQMAARALRYTWFDDLLAKQGYNYIATAHHKNDHVETILLNLAKGAVLKGLHGILPKNGHVIRPLLWAEKGEILKYASDEDISHREDKSNAESKYQRNIIRNLIMPLLQKINPDVADTVYKASARRLQLEEWMARQAEQVRVSIEKRTLNVLEFNVEGMLRNAVPPELFFQWIVSYNFNYVQVEALFANLASTESYRFYSIDEKLVMVKDRHTITISENTAERANQIAVYQDDNEIKFENIIFETETMTPNEVKDYKEPSDSFFDCDKLDFPLKVRRWQAGDFFYPFGMKGRKKISDYIADLKLNTIAKGNLHVICSGGDICAVVGHRIDDRFKVGLQTKKVFRIRILTAL